jgi:ribonuclease E
MGKVMPRFVPKPHHKQAKPEAAKAEAQVQQSTELEAVQNNVVIAGGFACPEMAMGKVIIRREEPVVEAVVEAKAEEVVAQPAVEAPVVETPVAQAPVVEEAPVVDAPVVEESVKAEETVEAKAEETVAEAPVVEVPITEAKPVKAAPVTEEKPSVEAKKQASSPMTKAPGPQEIKEIEIVAAPFRSERYVSKGAGSQVASNQAGSGMTKPNY